MLSTLRTLSFAAVTTLSLAALAPGSYAKNPAIAIVQPTLQTARGSEQTTPFNLVYLAYQGYLDNYGVPSYQGLIAGYRSGRLQAMDLVQNAVRAKLVAETALSDPGYLAAVNQQLNALSTNR